MKNFGFKEHKEVIKIYKETSIAVVCSRWDEPFGRTSLEAAANGCAVIISNRGGLPETITNGIILKQLSEKELLKQIQILIKKNKFRKKLQISSIKNFKLDHKFIANKIDNVRQKINEKFSFNITRKSKLKIIQDHLF